jgi:NhaP-type Na+/H+ or K+/H+ antiporter
MAALLLGAVAMFAYAVLSRRLGRTVVTAPIFFAGLGLLAGPVIGLVDLRPDESTVVALLEAALVMVLFTDASSLDIRRWTREPSLSGRLLGIGLPLTMLAGAVAAKILVPGLDWWQAALVGVILAPTDAALGQAVVADPRVPGVVRNALNVESGLNDGLALPFVTILITVGLIASGEESELHGVQTLVMALAGSSILGLGLGLVGGRLALAGLERRLADPRWLPIGLVALAVATYAAADGAGMSGFLAVWVAGLSTGAVLRDHVDDGAFALSEEAADVLAAIAFLVLGAGLIGPVLGRATPATLVYAALSLTLVRLLPVAVSMLRTGFAPSTVAYVGWFGPRGLASIVFAGMVVEAELPQASTITDVVLLTVAISIVAHGVTAAWGAGRYAAWFERAAEADPTMPEAADLPATHRRPRGARRSGAHATGEA